MPSLKKMLQPYDLDLIGRIGSFWGVDSTNLDVSSAINAVVHAMQDAILTREVLDSLPLKAKEAWEFLAVNPQKITWAQFIRKYGEIREYGPARREREDPELHPVSVSEILWYRGLIGRAFMNLPPEPREFVYIPDELIKSVDHKNHSKNTIKVESINGNLIKHEEKADSRLIDHMIDWLAAKRMMRKLPSSIWKCWGINEEFISGIAIENNLINKEGEPVTESLSLFFQQGRSEILLHWVDAWKSSTSYNDLRYLPGLVFEGDWQNDPIKPRQFLLDMLQEITLDTWYNFDSFVEAIKINSPDFQRPSGDYDSWFIRKTDSENFLRGFEHWDEIDGALIRYLICGPLHWLGMIDLGMSGENSDVFAFRKSQLHDQIKVDEKIAPHQDKEIPIKISTELVFTIPLYASRMLRYQIGRFCEVRSITAEETCYQITHASLQSAQNGGLKPSQLIQLLEKQLKTPLPKSLKLLAEHWEKYGLEVRVENVCLLRTRTLEIMQTLQQNSRTSKFILEVLSPTVAIINKQGLKLIRSTCMDQGMLTQIDLEV